MTASASPRTLFATTAVWRTEDLILRLLLTVDAKYLRADDVLVFMQEPASITGVVAAAAAVDDIVFELWKESSAAADVCAGDKISLDACGLFHEQPTDDDEGEAN